jgi:hypothetical protein
MMLRNASRVLFNRIQRNEQRLRVKQKVKYIDLKTLEFKQRLDISDFSLIKIFFNHAWRM